MFDYIFSRLTRYYNEYFYFWFVFAYCFIYLRLKEGFMREYFKIIIFSWKILTISLKEVIIDKQFWFRIIEIQLYEVSKVKHEHKISAWYDSLSAALLNNKIIINRISKQFYSICLNKTLIINRFWLWNVS